MRQAISDGNSTFGTDRSIIASAVLEAETQIAKEQFKLAVDREIARIMKRRARWAWLRRLFSIRIMWVE